MSINSFIGQLPLHTAGAVAAGQLLHLRDGGEVVVALDGVLQSGGRHGELHRRLGVLAGQQGVDQAAAEAVAAADAVDDVQVVELGEAVIGPVVEHGGPIVVKGALALPKGNGDLLKAELVRQLLGHGLVALFIQLAGGDVGSLGLNAEHVLGVLLVGDAHVHVLAQVGHGRTGLVPGPQLAPVVQVAGNLDVPGLGRLTGLPADLHHVALYNFTLDREMHSLTVGGSIYYYDDDLLAYQEGSSIPLSELSEQDTVCIKGVGQEIYTLQVMTGHGVVALENTELFLGGYITIGNLLSQKITPQMRVEVAEGTYLLAVANDGYGGSREITVEANKETKVDLDELKGDGPSFCQIEFAVTPENAEVFLDGEQLDFHQPIQVRYGTHHLTAKADGYVEWTRKLIVNSATAKLKIEMTTVEEAEQEEDTISTANPPEKNNTNNNNSNNNNSSNNNNNTNNTNNNNSNNNNNNNNSSNNTNNNSNNNTNNNKSNNNNSNNSNNNSSNNNNTSNNNTNNNSTTSDMDKLLDALKKLLIDKNIDTSNLDTDKKTDTKKENDNHDDHDVSDHDKNNSGS